MDRYRAGEAVPLSEVYDYWAACFICVAAGVWIILQLPAVLAPSSVTGIICLVLIGTAGGASAVVGLLVAIFYAVTSPYCRQSAPSIAASAALKPPGKLAGTATACSQANAKQISVGKSSSLGPQLCRKGKYSGQVWTVPASAWCDTNVLHEFPPATSGPAAVATCWQASCKHGCLILVANPAVAGSGVVRKVQVQLDGCAVEVVTECLPTGKSVWWRKAPLLINHPSQPLAPYGQQSFYMFADNAAAKEQWLLALQWSTAAAGKQLQQTQLLYEAFCRPVKAAAATQNAPLADGQSDLSGVNLLIARVIFELLNSNAAEARVGGMLQKWLDDIRRPAYLERAKLVDLDLGCAAPIITGFKAASCPGSGITAAPLVQSDVSYQGTITLYIETSVDLHTYAMNMKHNGDRSSNHSQHSSPKRPSAAAPSNRAAKTLGHSSSFVKQPAGGHRAHHHQRNISSPPAFSPARCYSAPDVRKQQLPAAARSTVDVGSNPAMQPMLGLQRAVQPAADGVVYNRLPAGNSSANEDAEDETDNAMHAAVASTLRCEQSCGANGRILAGGSSGSKFSGTSSPSKAGKKLLNMLHLRKATEQALIKAISNVPARFMHIPIQLVVEVTKLEGTLLMWIPPPPSNRLWLSFLAPPKVELCVKPVIAGRTLHYPVLSNRVSRWLEGRLLRSLGSSMVFPAAADLSMPWFAGSTCADPSRYSTTASVTNKQQQRGRHQQHVGPLTAGLGYGQRSASGSRFTATGLTARKLQQRMADASMQQSTEADTNSSDLSSEEAPDVPSAAVPLAEQQHRPRQGTAVRITGHAAAIPDPSSQLGNVAAAVSASVADPEATADISSSDSAYSPVKSCSPVPGLRQRKQQQQHWAGAASGVSDNWEPRVSDSIVFGHSVPGKAEPMSSLVGPLAPRMPLEREGSWPLRSVDASPGAVHQVSNIQSQVTQAQSVGANIGSGCRHCEQQQHHKQGSMQCTDLNATSNQPAAAHLSTRSQEPVPQHVVAEASISSVSSHWLLQQSQAGDDISQQPVSCSLESNLLCMDNISDSQYGHRYANTSSVMDESRECVQNEAEVFNTRRDSSFVGKLFGKLQKKKKRGGGTDRVLQEVFELRTHSADDADMRKSLQGSRLRQSYRGHSQLHTMRYTDTAAAVGSHLGNRSAELHEHTSPSAASQRSSPGCIDVQWQLHRQQTLMPERLQRDLQALNYIRDCEPGCAGIATGSLPETSDFSFNSSLQSGTERLQEDTTGQSLSEDATSATTHSSLCLQDARQQQVPQHTAVQQRRPQLRSFTDTMLTALTTGRSHSSSPAKHLMQRLDFKTLGGLGQCKVSGSEGHGQQANLGSTMLLKAFHGKVREKVDGVKERMGDMKHKVGSMTDRVAGTVDSMRGRVGSILVHSNSSVQRSNSMPLETRKEREPLFLQQQKQRHQLQPAVSESLLVDHSCHAAASSNAALSNLCNSSGCTTSNNSSRYTRTSDHSTELLQEQQQRMQDAASRSMHLQPHTMLDLHPVQQQPDACIQQSSRLDELPQATHGHSMECSLVKVQNWQEQWQWQDSHRADTTLRPNLLQSMTAGSSAGTGVATSTAGSLCIAPVDLPAAPEIEEAAGQPSLRSWHEVVSRTSSSSVSSDHQPKQSSSSSADTAADAGIHQGTHQLDS